jgi:hypothetical protein
MSEWHTTRAGLPSHSGIVLCGRQQAEGGLFPAGFSLPVKELILCWSCPAAFFRHGHAVRAFSLQHHLTVARCWHAVERRGVDEAACLACTGWPSHLGDGSSSGPAGEWPTEVSGDVEASGDRCTLDQGTAEEVTGGMGEGMACCSCDSAGQLDGK